MKREKSELKIGIVLNYVNMLIGTLIPIIYTPVMLRLLGQNEYGLYKLSSGVTSYLGLISMGLGSAVSRYLIKAQTEQGKDAEEKVLGLFMIIFRFIAAAAFVIGSALTLHLGIWYGDSLSAAELDKMKIIVFILVCNTALSFIVSPYMSVVSTHEKFLFMQIMNIITTCVGPIANIIVLFFGAGSVGMATSSLLLALLTRFLYIYYIQKSIGIRPQYQGTPRYLLKEILAFSFWIFVANLVNQLYNATDTVMIGAVAELGTAGVAVYNVGTTFTSMMLTLTIGVSSLLSPKTHKMVFSGAGSTELTDLAIRVGRLQGYAAILIASGFVAFGRPFIQFYAGVEYADAYWVAVFVMIPNMIPLVQSVCLNIIVAQNKHKFRSLVYFGIAVLNVFGTWILMQTALGVKGAALMTGIATIVGQGFAMNWFYWRKVGLDMRRFWKILSRQYAIPFLMSAVTLLLYRWINFYDTVIMVFGIVIYTGVYCILNWMFIMNDYEKNLVLGPMKRIGRLFGRG